MYKTCSHVNKKSQWQVFGESLFALPKEFPTSVGCFQELLQTAHWHNFKKNVLAIKTQNESSKLHTLDRKL